LAGGGTSGDVTLQVAVPLQLSLSSTTSGVIVGVCGENSGYLGLNSYGVIGRNNRSDNYGYLADRNYGVYGKHTHSGNYGFIGSNGFGVSGVNYNSNFGYLGGSDYGVYGKNSVNGNFGYLGGDMYGVNGFAASSLGMGVRGTAAGTLGTGVHGEHNVSGNYGALGTDAYGVYGYGNSGNNYAGYFSGPVHVNGTLSKSAGSFRIDHPLDPANKYLQHSFVESPDMMNVYNGNIILDDNGEVVVELPDWFKALNRDFRYQLTAIGAPGPDLYIAREITKNQFAIAGGKPGMKVSWQVTGIRHDAFANANRIQVEVEKKGDERGLYLHPEYHGMPADKGMHRELERK